MTRRSVLASIAWVALCAGHAVAQTAPPGPAPAPAVALPAEVSPLFVVTYVEARPVARDEASTLLASYRNASRGAAGNLRSVVLRSSHRPGQFVIVAAWKDKAAWEAHSDSAATRAFRDKLHALRNVPADDRFHNALASGPIDVPAVPGAVYVVSHVDAIAARKDDAIAALKSMADASRSAEGNIRYEVVQQTNRPNHFTVVEAWRSRQAFDAQGVSAHSREFRDRMSSMIGALYDERLYEILD